MKKTLKLIPAVVMLLISAILVSTSTYAWFSMNTQVKATGMQIQAKSEGGIVIANESGTDWSSSATASHNSVAYLVPTSTSDVTIWYHNKSDEADNAKAGQAADTYTIVSSDTKWKNVDGVQFIDVDGDNTLDTEENAYFLLNKFYIKSSAEAINPATLKINKVTATGASTSASLDASLRIAVKIGGYVYIYAPVTGATLSYSVAHDTAVTATASTGNGIVNTTAAGVANIPDNTASTTGTTKPIEAQIFIYFEGEDANCKSSNITTTLDTLQVEVVFGTTDLTNP